MGLYVEVFRAASITDCTNGGISAYHNEIWLANVSGPHSEPRQYDAAAILESHYLGCLRIVPAIKKGNSWVPLHEEHRVGPMFGGNYAATSDGRFSEACALILGHRWYGAVAIHDRFETQQEYARNFD